MAGVNKVIIVGNLGNAPEMRAMPNGDAVATISVATSEAWNDKNTGERREATEWHRIVFYRRQAEIVGQYLQKGSKIYVEGRLRTRKWQDQSGQERYTTEIQGDVLQMLDSRPTNTASVPSQAKAQPSPTQTPSQQDMPPMLDDFDDSIPF